MVDKALEVVKRDWEHIRSSLAMRGDTGDFNPHDFALDKPTFKSNLSCPITYLMEMDKQLIRHEYSKPEALDVFLTLTLRNAEKLELSEGLPLLLGVAVAMSEQAGLDFKKLIRSR